MAVTTTKPVALTWLQCQLPRSEWDALNDRRKKLNLKWSDIIVPAAKAYITRLEARAKKTNSTATDASAEAPVTPTIENKADKRKVRGKIRGGKNNETEIVKAISNRTRGIGQLPKPSKSR